MVRWTPASRRGRGEEGYLIVEAAVALPIYVAFMLIVLSISSWAIAQAQVTVALNQTATEISQYRYVRTTKIGGDVAGVKKALDDFSRGLGGSGDAFNAAGSENPLVQAFNSDARAGARALLNKHLSGSDASLKAMGIVGGAGGVDLTADTSVDDDRVVLDAEYTLRVLFFWDIKVDMRAHAETGVWGSNR